jgi:hypothetical protein
VARKKRTTHRWRRALLIFVVTPVTVWLLAFLIWLFWLDMVQFLAPGKSQVRRAATPASELKQGEGRDGQPAKRSRENISDEDRKKLDDILQRR